MAGVYLDDGRFEDSVRYCGVCRSPCPAGRLDAETFNPAGQVEGLDVKVRSVAGLFYDMCPCGGVIEEDGVWLIFSNNVLDCYIGRAVREMTGMDEIPSFRARGGVVESGDG